MDSAAAEEDHRDESARRVKAEGSSSDGSDHTVEPLDATVTQQAADVLEDSVDGLWIVSAAHLPAMAREHPVPLGPYLRQDSLGLNGGAPLDRLSSARAPLDRCRSGGLPFC